MYENSGWSMSWPSLGMVSLFHFSHSNRYVGVSRGGLICIFLMSSNVVEYLFKCLFAMYISSLVNDLVICLDHLSILPFFWVLCLIIDFREFLYVLGTSPLLDI